jgi:hypothetical protein
MKNNQSLHQVAVKSPWTMIHGFLSIWTIGYGLWPMGCKPAIFNSMC